MPIQDQDQGPAAWLTTTYVDYAQIVGMRA
jgi:hypothetical protein